MSQSSEMHTHLPTGILGSWSATALQASLIDELKRDRTSKNLKMFFYAVTNSGWREIRNSVKEWRRLGKGRSVVAFIGTDDAITDPLALENMLGDDVDVRLMEEYQGIFHPKVVWLEGAEGNVVWVGSNNLTKRGLLLNVEFAVVVRSADIPTELKKWADAVESGSSILTPELLLSYKQERKNFEAKRARANVTSFTWSKRSKPTSPAMSNTEAGDLIVEVMPKETGMEGTQIQLPKKAAERFFELTRLGARRTIVLNPKGTPEMRRLTMTMFENYTVRLSVSDLEYRDRPCVIVFRKVGSVRVQFEIVSQNIFPSRYKALLALCNKRTREGSRHWTIVKKNNQ